MNLRIFNLAKKMASFSTHDSHHHGCVIVNKHKRPVGFGFNKDKTHSASNHSYKSIHAELAAILNSGLQDFKGYELYVVRVRKDGEFANSKPCKFCKELIDSLGFDKVHYSTDIYFQTEEV